MGREDESPGLNCHGSVGSAMHSDQYPGIQLIFIDPSEWQSA